MERVVHSGHLARTRSVQQLPPKPVQQPTCCCCVSGVAPPSQEVNWINVLDGRRVRLKVTAEGMKCVRHVSQCESEADGWGVFYITTTHLCTSCVLLFPDSHTVWFSDVLAEVFFSSRSPSCDFSSRVSLGNICVLGDLRDFPWLSCLNS